MGNAYSRIGQIDAEVDAYRAVILLVRVYDETVGGGAPAARELDAPPGSST